MTALIVTRKDKGPVSGAASGFCRPAGGTPHSAVMMVIFEMDEKVKNMKCQDEFPKIPAQVSSLGQHRPHHI